MNGSMWLLTATCLAWGAPDSATTAGPAQPGPAPLVIQNPNASSRWYGGTHDSARVEECNEHPGLLARLFNRLRALFTRSHSDSCCEGVAKCDTGHSSLCNNCGDCEQHGWSLRERLAKLFHHPCPEDSCCSTPAQPMIVQMLPPTTVLPPVQLTAPIPTSAPIQPVSTVPPQAVRTPAMEIAREYLHKVANADDYSWVTGQLFYIHIHADQGLWLVRYAPVDNEDRYGGSVVLASAASMANFREGDLVTVHGEILNQGRGSRYLGGPLYRALAVELRERARP